jgi:hypothetical protein
MCIHRALPTVWIEPETHTISQRTLGVLRCTATGDPAPSIKWSKLNEELRSNVQVSLTLSQLFSVVECSFQSWNSRKQDAL